MDVNYVSFASTRLFTASTFAWSLRLLRYYRAVPWASEEKAAERRRQPEAAPSPAKEPDRPVRSAAPALPAVGDIFHAKVLDLDDDMVMVEALRRLPGHA